MSASSYTAAERLFIVPQAHTALLDTRFQVEMYELFHRTPGGRIGHFVGTPTILLGAFLALRLATGSWHAGAAVLAAMALFALRVDRIAALLTAVLGAGLLMAAGGLAASVAGAGWLALGLAVGGCMVQTLSHMFEEVPPPHSGTDEFVPMPTWMRSVGIRELLRSTALTFGVFYWLEMWATFRIWPLQILHMLMALGYRRELREHLKQRNAEIVADPTTDWRMPQGLSLQA